MEEKIEELQKAYTYIRVEKIEEEILDMDANEVETLTEYKISNFNGNKNISVQLREEEQLKELENVLSKNVTVLDEFLGVNYDGIYEIVISPVNNRTMVDFLIRKRKIEAKLNYFKNELEIVIERPTDYRPSLFFNNYIRQGLTKKSAMLMTIRNFKRSSHEGFNIDLRNIITSVLFDIEYSFGTSFEADEINNLNRRFPRFKRQANQIPSEAITFTYKKYIPELIQYFHLAEKVDYIPFKYVCYYHIIEYFSDKSAYYTIREQIRQILIKPDFHLKADSYINSAVNIFKKENEKHLTDKIKLTRSLQQFVDPSEFKNYLEEIKLLNRFTAEQTINCSKPLKLAPLDFSNDSQFYQTLANRIYALRCSIVHSNPDFDETKAVPFVHTSENIFRLNIEIALLYEVARNIILKSSELR
ncbi:MAG: hypothetical protein ACTHM5_00910 [Ginsengibacter sp.]